MNSTTILILVATVAVIALTLIPTYIISGRKKTTQADWEVADRSLPLYVVIGTQFASAMGGGILVAHVGNAYTRGIGHFIYGVLASLPVHHHYGARQVAAPQQLHHHSRCARALHERK